MFVQREREVIQEFLVGYPLSFLQILPETLDLRMTRCFIKSRYHENAISLGLFLSVVRQLETACVSRSRRQLRRRLYTPSTEIPQRILQNNMGITPAIPKAVDRYPMRSSRLPRFRARLNLMMSEEAKLEQEIYANFQVPLIELYPRIRVMKIATRQHHTILKHKNRLNDTSNPTRPLQMSNIRLDRPNSNR